MSVCSDDTELLLSTPFNTDFKNLQSSYLNKSPDKYSMTEQYINGISNNSTALQSSISEGGWNYHHDSEKSPFTALERCNKKYSVPSMMENIVPISILIQVIIFSQSALPVVKLSTFLLNHMLHLHY